MYYSALYLFRSSFVLYVCRYFFISLVRDFFISVCLYLFRCFVFVFMDRFSYFVRSLFLY